MTVRQAAAHPLEETLHRLGPVGARLSLSRPGRPLLADQLLRSPADLHAALGRFAAAVEAEPEVAASQFSKKWAVSVARAAVGAFAAERRVPDVTATNAAIVFDPSGRPAGLRLMTPRFAALPEDPASAWPTAVAVPDEAGLRAWLRARALDGHLRALVDGMAAIAPIGRRRLWGNVAAACASAFSALSARHPETGRLVADATTLLDAPGTATRGLVRLVPLQHGEKTLLFVRRETCCLRYRLRQGSPPCLSCPLLSDAERRRQATLRLSPARP